MTWLARQILLLVMIVRCWLSPLFCRLGAHAYIPDTIYARDERGYFRAERWCMFCEARRVVVTFDLPD